MEEEDVMKDKGYDSYELWVKLERSCYMGDFHGMAFSWKVDVDHF